MARIDRYVLRQLLAGALSIPAILLLLLWTTRSLRYVDLVVEENVPVTFFFRLALTTLPQSVALVLPLCLFVATLISYQRLIAGSELVVMQAAGMSPLQVARPALIAASVAGLLTAALTVWGVPAAETAKRHLQYQVNTELGTAIVESGKFSDVGGGFVIYARERSGDGNLRDIMVHQTYPDRRRTATIFAQRGNLVETPAGYRLALTDGSRQEFNRAGKKLDVLYFDRHVVTLDRAAQAVGRRDRDPRERSLMALLFPEPHVAAPSKRREWRMIGHQRILQPLYTVAFMLVAMAALTYGEVSRRGVAKRIIAAVAVAVAAQAAAMAMMNAARGDGLYIVATYLLVAGLVVGALALMHRRPRRRRWRRPPPGLEAAG